MRTAKPRWVVVVYGESGEARWCNHTHLALDTAEKCMGRWLRRYRTAEIVGSVWGESGFRQEVAS